VRFSETDYLKQGFLEIEGMKQAQKQTNRSGKGMRVAPAKLGRLGGIAESCMAYKKYGRLKEAYDRHPKGRKAVLDAEMEDKVCLGVERSVGVRWVRMLVGARGASIDGIWEREGVKGRRTNITKRQVASKDLLGGAAGAVFCHA